MILIYPEQSLWWNYKKPKPLKQGGYRIASRNMVPVIPIFITMEDSNLVGDDGFTIQEYTINIGKPIYPDKKLSEKENTKSMKEKNADVWKEVYEDFYKVPLTYTTPPEKMPN
jgi:1-acyl-sn-glycerol-3-phosphate acyltransferase